MENNNPENKKSNIIGNGLKAAVIAAGVMGSGSVSARDQQEQANMEAMMDKYVVSPSNLSTLASVKNLQSAVNSKYTTEDFNNKGYGGVTFFLRNAGKDSTMSVEVVFFEKGEVAEQVIDASLGVKTITVTLDAVIAKNKYAMEALLSGVVAKELGK